jgi:hypothetical protein
MVRRSTRFYGHLLAFVRQDGGLIGSINLAIDRR